MDNQAHTLFHVADRSYFALVKKDIHAFGVALGFSSERAGQLDIIIAELLSNIFKYVGEGSLFVKNVTSKDNPGLEIICTDCGPGIADIKKMMQDGVSTQNTLGHGLGAISRLSDVFEVYTQKDFGTVLLSRIYKEPLPLFEPKHAAEVKAVLVPKKGETLCGDGYFYKSSAQYLKILLGDGLGHGPEANKAVSEAIHRFKYCHENDPVEIIKYLHDAVRKTRGLVASVVVFDFEKREWNMCGVGNIQTRIANYAGTKMHGSYNGIIGHNLPRSMTSQRLQYEEGHHLVMCSDGIKTKWELSNYPGILMKDLSVLSAAVYKDHTRNSDDASVLAAKINL